MEKKHERIANMFYRFVIREFKRKKIDSAKKKKNYAITTYHIFIESISSIERFRVTDLIKRLINVKTISTRKNIYNTKEKKL